MLTLKEITDLLKENGLYKEMYESQRKYYLEENNEK